MVQQGPRIAPGLLATAVLLLQPACAPAQRADDDSANGDGGGASDDGGGNQPTDFDDFPVDPMIEPGAPAGAPGLFEPDGPTTGGPCVLEPQAGTLFPRDWLRPRFSFTPAGNQNLFEIRVHAQHEHHDLVVYTSETSWTMPKLMWTQLNLHVLGQEVTVSVRGAHYNGSGLDAPAAASQAGSFTIAPVPASGTIAYWTTGGGSSVAFKGFRVGDETVQQILTPNQANAGCVGCHTSTPDGKFVAFSSTVDPGDGGNAKVDLRSVDGMAAQPTYATSSAMQLLARTSQQAPAFSPGHWNDSEKIALSMYDIDGYTQIAWTNLAASSSGQGVGWGLLARQGDGRSAAAVAFSHSGDLVAYSSSDSVGSGVNLGADRGGDLYTVPFSGGAGGTATPVAGASNPSYSEHYAAFSADDVLLAFIRVPSSMSTYDNAVAEVFVVPTAGGTATRVAANDPPTCSGAISPGITNSWPKWSPETGSSAGSRYYWLTFSSRRSPSRTPQLYITGVTVDELGSIKTYPAIYLWNQPEDESNHTPAWDNFDIVIN